MNFLRHYWSEIFIFLTLLSFLFIKLFFLSIRFGDSNAYFYAAQAILQGHFLYSQVFVVVPPMLIYFLALILAIFPKQALLLQLSPVILEMSTAVILSLLCRKLGSRFYFLAPLIYLFSFTILSTSDYVTGVQLTVFFSSLAIYLFQKDKLIPSGIFFALSILTKFYASFILIGFFIEVLLTRKLASIIRFNIAFVLTLIFILAPYLILAPNNTFQDLILHQINRPAGLSKMEIIGFFLSHEWLVISLALLGAFLSKFPHKRAYLISLSSLITFLLIFKDLYYIYVASIYFLLTIFATTGLEALFVRLQNLKIFSFCLVLSALFLVLLQFEYFQSTRLLGLFTNSQEVANFVQTLPSTYPLYGSHEVAPLIALYLNRPLFNQIADTNSQVFAASTLNLEEVSNQAATNGVYFIARTIDQPELKLKDTGFEGYFAAEIFTKYCDELKKFPSLEYETYNTITVYLCKRS